MTCRFIITPVVFQNHCFVVFDQRGNCQRRSGSEKNHNTLSIRGRHLYRRNITYWKHPRRQDGNCSVPKRQDLNEGKD